MRGILKNQTPIEVGIPFFETPPKQQTMGNMPYNYTLKDRNTSLPVLDGYCFFFITSHV
jgi:hypothetical protein